MTAPNKLEISGKLVRHPLPELLVEIGQIELSGSLRVSNGPQKVVVYFEKGEIVFAVSNSRKHRLFEILLAEKRIAKKDLAEIENFTNDLYLTRSLINRGTFTKETADALFSVQIGRILEEATYWNDGEWTFSSLARIKDGIRFPVDTGRIFYQYAKKLDPQKILTRFKSFEENFGLNPKIPDLNVNLTPPEAFALTRLENGNLSIENLKSMSGLSTTEIVRTLYALWLGGFLHRFRWNSVFNPHDVEKINSARLTLIKSALSVEQEQQRIEAEKERQREEKKKAAEAEKKAARQQSAEEKHVADLKISLEEYLDRIERAATHYDIFGVRPEVEIPAIKRAYFSLAKKFHPDLYYKQVEPELHSRIQHAFTELAHAYEILRDPETREVYDFKLRKVLEALKDRGEDISGPITKEAVDTSDKTRMAAENFDNGYDLLMDGNYYDALPLLGRAVHLENENARYHAFYGKALCYDKAQRHKAEAELQAAVRLDPQNTVYRIMLAELFIEIGFKTRARGELNRILEIAPGDAETLALLDSLN